MSPDGDRIITGSGTARVWDAGSGALLAEFTGHDGPVAAVAVSPDGGWIVSGSEDRTVRVWDAGSGAVLAELTAHDGPVLAVAVSSDGRIVSGGDDRTVRVWDAGSGALLAELTGHDGPVFAVAVSPDGGRIISGSFDHTVRVWDAGSGALLAELTGHQEPVFAVAVSPDGGRIISGSEDRTVRVWDAASGALLAELTGHQGPVFAVAVSPDGDRMISGSFDGTARVWALPLAYLLPEFFRGRAEPVWGVAVSPDGGRIISGSGTVRVWDAVSGAVLAELTGHQEPVLAVAVSPDGERIVSGSQDRTVRVWDAVSGAVLAELTGHDGPVFAVAVSPDGGRIVSGSGDRTVRVWDAVSGAVLAELTGHDGPVTAVAISPDGGRIVSGSGDRTVRVWDAGSGALLAELTGHHGPVAAVAVSPGADRIISGSGDHTVRVWDAVSGALLAELTGPAEPVFAVAVSPDGGRIISGGPPGCTLWRIYGGRPAARLWLAAPASDQPADRDRLEIAAEVNRLAELVAANSTQAPLAIALLGDWGSGKSSFAKLMCERIKELAAQRARVGGDRAFVSNVRQISFNAWHYSDETIWSGLILHLFRGLSEQPDPDRLADPAAAARRRHELQETLQERRQARENIERRLGDPEPQTGLARSLVSVGRAFRVAWALQWLYRRDIRVQLRTLIVPWLVVFGLGCLVWWRLGAVIGAAAAAVGAVLAPVVAVAAGLRKVNGKIAAVVREQEDTLRQEAQSLQAEIRRLEEDLLTVDAETRLATLVQQVATGDDYIRFRGVLGQAYDHLQRFNKELLESRQKWQNEPEPKGPPPIERIVLYVDDLDRCPPRRVVEVLSVVHLLLALELFVVVVAVDSRWLERSLDSYHRHLFNPQADETGFGAELAGNPLDFLDKIFQIPYGLPPMTAAGARNLFKDILPVTPTQPVQPSTAPRAADPASTHGIAPAGTTESSSSSESPRPSTTTLPTAAQQLVAVRRPATDVGSLTVTAEEQDFLADLGLIMPTPRAVKKFANLYRLTRIAYPSSELPHYLGTTSHGGPYQAVAILLSIIVGRPDRAVSALEQLLAAHYPGNPIEILHKLHPDAPGWQPVPDVLDRLRSKHALFSDLGEYQRRAVELSRYSFHTQKLWKLHAPRQ